MKSFQQYEFLKFNIYKLIEDILSEFITYFTNIVLTQVEFTLVENKESKNFSFVTIKNQIATNLNLMLTNPKLSLHFGDFFIEI